MSQEFGNHFIRKPAEPGDSSSSGLPSRPVILPPKRVVTPAKPEPEPVAEVEAAPTEPKPIQVKPGPIRVELKKTAKPATAATPVPSAPAAPAAPAGPKRAIKRLETKPTYTKIFRWQLPEGQAAPATVEVAGTFNLWKKVPLEHDGTTDTWQVSIPNIPGHRPHHYMLFVDGQPAQDKNAEGLAMPQGPLEAEAALGTPRGPRVFLLSAQAR